MVEIELKTFDECLAYLPEGVERLKDQLTDETEEDKRRHVAQVFMAITPMLNHGKITFAQAEQFRQSYIQLTNHQVEFVQENGEWRLEL